MSDMYLEIENLHVESISGVVLVDGVSLALKRGDVNTFQLPRQRRPILLMRPLVKRNQSSIPSAARRQQLHQLLVAKVSGSSLTPPMRLSNTVAGWQR